MALIAEEVVEEWLRQQRYFTIRGIKQGVEEMDVLAVKPQAGKSPDLRHVEVHVSMNPVSHLMPWTIELQKELGIRSGSQRPRTAEQETECVEAWVAKKFKDKKKAALRESLYPGEWKYEFVVHKVKFPDETKALEKHNIKVIPLVTILADLEAWAEERKKRQGFTASGAPLIDLMLMRADKEPLVSEQPVDPD
jgi:hypothetical protein